MELKLYFDSPFPDLKGIPSPRVLATHPLDAFASSWHYFPLNPDLDLETNFDKFCQGVDIHRPFLDHVLGFWNGSQERPGKVLFLMYEDVKQDTKTSVKKDRRVLGVPFSPEEESEGKIEEICGLCSFEKLRDMETNKHGSLKASRKEMASKWCFRKGKVGTTY